MNKSNRKVASLQKLFHINITGNKHVLMRWKVPQHFHVKETEVLF